MIQVVVLKGESVRVYPDLIGLPPLYIVRVFSNMPGLPRQTGDYVLELGNRL